MKEQNKEKPFYQKWWVLVIGVFLIFWVIGTVDFGGGYQRPPDSPFVAQKTTARAEKCIAPSTNIAYSVLEEKDRQSDVKGILIHQCTILLGKVAPSIEEITNLATILGAGTENVEFRIFDTNEAYAIEKNFNAITDRGGSQDEISKSDWKIYDNHFLGIYLKANTQLQHNRLTLVSDIYPTKGDIQITN
ncbi:MAG: hypothetical protein NT098_06010 [Candidatus Parcubacteria bacterium]|nr:hypothetical protein [Candidatus Parcubacteria bacterium]